MLDSVDLAHADLCSQRSAVHEPLYLVRPEEAVALAFPVELLHLLLKLQQQRQLLVCNSFKPRHVEAPDLVGGDAEDLTQRGVGGVLNL